MTTDAEATHAYLQALVDREWQIKASLETRSSSLLSVLVGSLGAAFAVIALAGVKTELGSGAPLALSAASLTMLVITLLAVVAVNLPVNYPVVKEGDLRELLGIVRSEGESSPPPQTHLLEIADSFIDDLGIIRSNNKTKGWALIAGTFSFGLAILLFVTALLVSA